MSDAPTEKQRKILAFMTAALGGGICPSYREIGSQFDISVGTVRDQTKALVAKGLLIRHQKGAARAFSLPRNPEPNMPLVGRVGAGGAVIAEENLDGRLTFKDIAAKTDFLLRVRGDSMDAAGIFEGDLVQVRRQQDASDGDIVVAVSGDEGYVKTLRKRGGAHLLESANPRYASISREFRVVGKVVGLLRRYTTGGARW